MAPYSSQLYAVAGLAPAGGLSGPVVLAGFVYVLKDVQVVNRNPGGSSALEVFNAAGGFLAYVDSTVCDHNGAWHWSGMQVFNAGQRVGFQVAAGAWDVAASGYKLTA